MVAFQPPEGLACLTARGLFEQRIAQELGADQRAWLTSHLMTCDACSSELADSRTTVSTNSSYQLRVEK